MEVKTNFKKEKKKVNKKERRIHRIQINWLIFFSSLLRTKN